MDQTMSFTGKVRIEIGSCDYIDITYTNGSGACYSTLSDNLDSKEYRLAIEGIERLVMFHVANGVDVMDRKYIEGIESAVSVLADIYN